MRSDAIARPAPVPGCADSAPPAARRTPIEPRGESFGRALSRAASPDDAPHQAARELLATQFYAPLLAEMRRFPFGRRFADGGRTEAIFGEQLDQRLADAVAASNPGLTGTLAAQIAGSGRAARSTAPAGPTGRTP